MLAVDAEHLSELRESIKTWKLFRQEIWQNRLIIICDATEYSVDFWKQALEFVEHDNLSLHPVRREPSESDWSQREFMLSSFVLRVPDYIDTEYYLKLDTDAIATGPGKWIEPEWFTKDYSFISSPWGYTKPAEWLTQLDNWSQFRDMLRRGKVDYRIEGNIAKSRRMISYVMFGNTGFTKLVATLCDGRLPVPSQDTTLWYVSERIKWPGHYVKMKHLGWQHLGHGGRRLREAVAAVLEKYQ